MRWVGLRWVALHRLYLGIADGICLLRGYGRAVGDADIEPIYFEEAHVVMAYVVGCSTSALSSLYIGEAVIF